MNKKHDQALKFLQEHKVAILSTSKNDNPWGAAVYYGIGDDLSLYFLTHKDSHKYQDFKANPKAAFTVFDDNSQTTIQAVGTITEISIGDEHDVAFRKIARVHPPGQFAWVPPVSKLENGKTVLLKCTPQFMQLSEFKTSDGRPHITIVIGS